MSSVILRNNPLAMDYFFVSVVGFAVGALARSFLIFSWPVLVLLIFLSVIFAVLHFIKSAQIYFIVAIFIFTAALGAGRTMLAPQTLPAEFTPLLDTQVSLEGMVVADPDIRDTNQHITIEITDGDVHTRILAYAPQYPIFQYGERVKVSGEFKLPEPFETDGGRTFRYDHFLAKDGIFAVVQRAQVKSIAPPSGCIAAVMNTLYGAKHLFSRGIENALPEPSAGLAEGLLTGGKQGLGESLQDAFTVSGIVQIVVLSGYNVAVVADAILKTLSFLPLRFALSFAGVGILGFVIAAGAGASALRAGLMACVALFARASGRRYDALRALGFILVILLLLNPLSLAFDPGFDLSFAATIGLILGTPLIEPCLRFIRNTYLREIVTTTLAAQIAVLPLLLYETGNLSFVSVPANILVSLLVPLTMLLSFIAGFMGIIFPFIAPVFGIPAHLLLSAIIAIAEFSASLPFARIILPAFSIVFVAIAYLSLFLLIRSRR